MTSNLCICAEAEINNPGTVQKISVKFSDFRRHKSVQIEPAVIPQWIKLYACDYLPFV
jgi:hypothetical protein